MSSQGANTGTAGTRFKENTVLKEALLIGLVMLTVEFANLFYSIYALGLYESGRWTVFLLANLLLAVSVLALTAYGCVRWGSRAHEFGNIVRAGRQPSNEQSRSAVRSIFSWPRNGALLYVGAYAVGLAVTGAVLSSGFGFSASEAWFAMVLKFMAVLTQAVFIYYAGKIIERPLLGEAVERLFRAGDYEWPHFRLSIRYKIFLVIFCVAGYLLLSAVVMGITRTDSARRNDLHKDLSYWLEASLSDPDKLSNTDTGRIGDSSYLFKIERDKNVGEAAQILTNEEISRIAKSWSPLEIHDHKSRKTVLAAPLPGEDAHIVAAGHWSANTFQKTMFDVLSLSLAALLLTMAVTYLLVRDINQPLQKILDYLHLLSRGETEHGLRAYSEDEFGDFSRELFRTTSLLEERNRAKRLLNHIQETTVAIESNCSRTQAAATEQSSGAGEQAKAITESLNIANEMASTSRQIAESAREVQDDAEENLRFCETSLSALEESLSDFDRLGDFVDRLSGTVADMGRDMHKIEGVVGIVREVARQIDMISLNARIEAEKSGSNKRFRNVAVEVKRLAEAADRAVSDIKAIIKSARTSSEQVGKEASTGRELVRKSRKVSGEVRESFSEIEDRVRTTVEAARHIAVTTEQQKIASEEMAEAVSGISSAAEQIHQAMGMLSGTSNQLVNILEESHVCASH